MQLAELGEGGAIATMARILAPGALPAGWIGIGDDACVTELGREPALQEAVAGGRLAGAGLEILTTVDMLVEDVHFKMATSPPADLGWKALAVNVSDIYAMGGTPCWAVVAIALRGDLPLEWLEDLYCGLREAVAHFACPIVGGDTVGTPGPVVLSITVVGRANRPRLRSAARPGDIVAVTGPLGLSAAGLWALEHPAAPLPPAVRSRAQGAHRRPLPPGCPPELARISRMALMDDSDGLGTCARQLAAASDVAVVLESRRLSPDPDVVAIAAAAGVDPLEWQLWGGEDYGLVASFAADDPLPGGFRGVGRVEAGAGAWLERDGERSLLDREGFRHF